MRAGAALRPFGPGLWLGGGGAVDVLGFRYPTRMAVIEGEDGVALWSPVAATPALVEAVAALGPVRAIVAPNHLHHLFVADWTTLAPGARLLLAPGLARKRPDLAPAEEIDDGTTMPAGLAHAVLRGNAITTEVVGFHPPSGTALFTDLLQQFPRGWHSGWRGLVARLDLMCAPEPTVPRKFRVATRDRAAMRAGLDTVRAWPVERVAMAHGTPVPMDGAALIDRAFRWLGP
ncbi:DUF4336 domain-containing protein [Jannaschia sp. W003]|uniref:DUF4336 domain-containing protein n=1 Tax=Jannaschia sp. W003 TaxID=2867012 RepID=UPI0021A5B2C0|nr:DUF4336 domain-containing protein [Jannaschia sp. W003]UWQ20901.1 DUF4336 domain-containing protein [Jannaschia sp. W003]